MVSNQLPVSHIFPGLVEATAQKYSQRQPSFYGHIENKTVPVGRDVILGCQVENLGKDYKVQELCLLNKWVNVIMDK